jgi:hypothetical protein
MGINSAFKGLIRLFKSPQIFQKTQERHQNSRHQKGDLKQLHTKDPKILDVTVPKLFARATQRPAFVRP